MEEEEEEDSLPQISKYNKIKEKEKKKKTIHRHPFYSLMEEGRGDVFICRVSEISSEGEREKKKNRFCVASRRGIRIT